MSVSAVVMCALLAGYHPVHVYDPSRNAEADLKAAIAEARRSGKHVLMEVGGQWCVWCKIMDKFFEQNPDLLALREKNYVMLKVNFSPENENRTLLSRYPKIPGYPHIFVLDAEGKLLHSQNTAELEKGKSYDLPKFTEFLRRWAPSGAR